MYIICQICSKLIPILGDSKASLDVVAFTAISLGLVYVGSCNGDIAEAIICALMERESELGEPLTRLLPLGLGLLYLGKQVMYNYYLEGLYLRSFNGFFFCQFSDNICFYYLLFIYNGLRPRHLGLYHGILICL